LPFFSRMFLLIVITASIGSVLLYIVVYAMTRKSIRRARKTQMGSKAADAFERRQRKLTRTMNISCVITLIFYVTPMCARFFAGGTIDTTTNDFVTLFSGISCNFNPLAILAALFVMQEDVKRAVLSSLPHCLRRLIPSAAPDKTFGGNLSITVNPTAQQENTTTAVFWRRLQWSAKTISARQPDTAANVSPRKRRSFPSIWQHRAAK
uniref:G_PROTEIN_RECEP_F1_2 domain-containing protein n=1 Tax=Gongylonema pulchrum TaxID=637853 RepID=A0A183EVT5_9BILA